MRKNSPIKVAAIGGLVLLVSGTASGSPYNFAAETRAMEDASGSVSERASRLLAEIQEEAAQLWWHAGTLRSLARNSQISWQSHAEQLERVKESINTVGVRTAELQAIRGEMLPWQQQATTEVTSHAVAVANGTDAAIRHLQENRNLLFAPDYRDHVMTIAEHSEDMKQAVDKFLDYDKTKQKMQKLEGDLGLVGS